MTRIWTEIGLGGARAAAERGDVVVLIDALRSSVTITAALAAGARKVIPLETVEEAHAYLRRRGVLVAGEQGGVAVAGLDYGNSPTQLLADTPRLRGQVLMLVTSNGTPLVRASAGASAVLAGSLPNARAVSRAALHLAQEAGRGITLLAAGGAGGPVAEDDYAVAVLAEWLRAGGQDGLYAEQASIEAQTVFATAANGQKLAALGYSADVAECARLNSLDVVGIMDGEGFVPWKTG